MNLMRYFYKLYVIELKKKYIKNKTTLKLKTNKHETMRREKLIISEYVCSFIHPSPSPSTVHYWCVMELYYSIYVRSVRKVYRLDTNLYILISSTIHQSFKLVVGFFLKFLLVKLSGCWWKRWNFIVFYKQH